MAPIACSLADDFEDSGFCDPRADLMERRHQVVVGSAAGQVSAENGATVTVDATPAALAVDRFDGLAIGGGCSPDHLCRAPRSASGGDLGRPVRLRGGPISAVPGRRRPRWRDR